MRFRILVPVLAASLALAGCSQGEREFAQCGSAQAERTIDALLKEELEFAVQNRLDAQKALGSYDATELGNAVDRLNIALEDVRTSRDDPNSERSSCRATLSLTIPDLVERKANETRAMAEVGTVRELANRYKMKRKARSYTSDFDYFIQPTDDGRKLFAEMDDDAPALSFLSEVLASYLLIDEVREEKIAEDMALAAEQREVLEAQRAEDAREQEINEAREGQAVAALNTAKLERKLASDRIGAIWKELSENDREELGDRHTAWVREMNARCRVAAAGSDPRPAVRETLELKCQTRAVRSCSETLRRNIGNRGRTISYCQYN